MKKITTPTLHIIIIKFILLYYELYNNLNKILYFGICNYHLSTSIYMHNNIIQSILN